MTFQQAQARIKSRVWQALAQTDLDLSGVDKATMEAVVNLITEAALLELDETLGESLETERPQAATADNVFDDDKEDVLWEGRPFLSLTMHYTITDERIRITEGILGKAWENIELVRIQHMDYRQTFSERLLKIGDIVIRSHDQNHPNAILRNVQDPESVYEILRRAVLKARKKHGYTYREEM